ncbi:MAG: glycosyltransferase family 4 protein [Planctomycetota bacterium]
MVNKLCYICEATQGGVRKHLCQLIHIFLRPEEGCEVYAILGDRGEPGFREELTQLAATHNNFRYIFVPELRRSIHPWRDLRAYRQIKAHLRSIAPDLIHTHSSKAGFLGRQAAQRLGIRNVIHTPHVFPFQWSAGLRGRMYLMLERHAAQFSRAIICVGQSQRDDALSRGVAEPEKLVVIPNGIEPPAPISSEQRAALRAALGLTAQTPAVGMVARLSPQKGVGIFVRAAALVLKKKPETVFLLVGSGPLEGEVRRRATELNLPPEKFRLLGHREDAEALYPGFDVLVLSSLYEGLPYVLLEAMAWGVPVVATDVLGSRDVVVNGEAGLLAQVSDPDDIARQTLSLLNDPAQHARHSAASRQRVVREFSFKAFVDAHRRLYWQ